MQKGREEEKKQVFCYNAVVLIGHLRHGFLLAFFRLMKLS